MMRIHRLIAILLLLESRGKMKARELAEALETSVRSVYRDIDTLGEAGIPVIASPGPGGGISLMKGYSARMNSLNGDDVLQLYLTGMGIPAGRERTGRNGSGSGSAARLRNALLKLERQLPAAYAPSFEAARKRFYFDDRPWWEERPDIPCLEELRSAVLNSETVQVEYAGPGSGISVRRLRPYGLVVKNGVWYTAAYCETRSEVRIFKCERISGLAATGEHFDIPDDFQLERYWKQREAGFRNGCAGEEYYPVQLRLSGSRAALADRLEILESRIEGDNLLLTVNMFSFEAACRELPEWIGTAEFCAPPELRAAAGAAVRRLVQVYGEAGPG